MERRIQQCWRVILRHRLHSVSTRFQHNIIFCLFESLSIYLSCSVKCGSITEIQEKQFFVLWFLQWVSQFDFSPLMSVLLQLPIKLKSCLDNSQILQCTFILEFPYALFVSRVRSTDNLAIIKTQNVAPQKHQYLSVYYIYQFWG